MEKRVQNNIQIDSVSNDQMNLKFATMRPINKLKYDPIKYYVIGFERVSFFSPFEMIKLPDFQHFVCKHG